MAHIVINRSTIGNADMTLSKELKNASDKPYRWLTFYVGNKIYGCYCCESFMEHIPSSATVKDLPEIISKVEGQFCIAPATDAHNQLLYFEDGNQVFQIQKMPETVKMTWT